MLLDGFLVWKNYILEFVLVDAQLAQNKKVAGDKVYHCLHRRICWCLRWL